jgi:glycerol-3-phosphate acyltransferase PlsX
VKRPVRVAVDAMGGDRAPEEVVAGALAAASSTVEPVLFGPSELDPGGLELVPAPQRITMDEKPAEVVRSKPDSSLVAACRAVGAGRADAVVSAGRRCSRSAASRACFARRLQSRFPRGAVRRC